MTDSIRWDVGASSSRYDQAARVYLVPHRRAVQFGHWACRSDALHWIHRRSSQDLSLYVHVPFCANICYLTAPATSHYQGSQAARALSASPYREIELVH